MRMRKMQSALPDLIGRTISQIVVCEREDSSQLFLFFTDGTYYEFYGGIMNGVRHLDVGTIEVARDRTKIPVGGRLEILDAQQAYLIENPDVLRQEAERAAQRAATAAIAAAAPVAKQAVPETVFLLPAPSSERGGWLRSVFKRG